MSENITAASVEAPEVPAAAPESTPQAPVTPVEPEATEKLTAEQLRSALDAARKDAAKYRTKYAEAKPIVEAHEAAEEAAKTQAQRDAEERERIAKERDEFELKYNVSELARTHNLTSEDLNFLGSGTREELEARAEYLGQLRANITPAETKAPPTDRPVESLRPGASPQPQQVEDNSYPAAWRPAARDRS